MPTTPYRAISLNSSTRLKGKYPSHDLVIHTTPQSQAQTRDPLPQTETSRHSFRHGRFDHSPRQVSARSGDIIFYGEKLLKHYEVRPVQFQLSIPGPVLLRSGEILGLAGPNGSGKSTLLRIVAGELRSERGQLRYPLFDDGTLDWRRIRTQIAFVPQRLSQWPGRLEENLRLIAAFHGITGQENDTSVNYIVERLGLDDVRRAAFSQLSGGSLTRYALAAALVWQPRLLVLDEPLAPVDVPGEATVLRDITELAKSRQSPIAVIVSSQNIYGLEHFVDSILFWNHGECKFYGALQELWNARRYNCYEVAGPHTLSDFREALEETATLSVSMAGGEDGYLVQTEISFAREALLSTLISKGDIVWVDLYR